MRSAKLRRASLRRLPARISRVTRRHFLAQIRMAQVQFARHVLDRLIESQARLDRDHHQIQRIGQRQAQSLLALGAPSFQEEARQIPSRRRCRMPSAQLHYRGWRGIFDSIITQSTSMHQRDHDAQPVENRQRILASGSRRESGRPSDWRLRPPRTALCDRVPGRNVTMPLLDSTSGVAHDRGRVGDHRAAQLPHESCRACRQPVADPADQRPSASGTRRSKIRADVP